MHEDLQSIVAADLAARRDLEDVKQRLAARHENERARLQAARAAAGAAARARLDADVRAVEEDGRTGIEKRRAARAALRARRRELAGTVEAAAIAAYVRILRGDAGHGETS